jgi:hypothetical protein
MPFTPDQVRRALSIAGYALSEDESSDDDGAPDVEDPADADAGPPITPE